MKNYKTFERSKDNQELISEVRDLIKRNNYNSDAVIECLLSDISISLAMIADILNNSIDYKEKKE